jgi:hypothetical protein
MKTKNILKKVKPVQFKALQLYVSFNKVLISLRNHSVGAVAEVFHQESGLSAIFFIRSSLPHICATSLPTIARSCKYGIKLKISIYVKT